MPVDEEERSCADLLSIWDSFEDGEDGVKGDIVEYISQLASLTLNTARLKNVAYRYPDINELRLRKLGLVSTHASTGLWPQLLSALRSQVSVCRKDVPSGGFFKPRWSVGTRGFGRIRKSQPQAMLATNNKQLNVCVNGNNNTPNLLNFEKVNAFFKY